MTKTIARYAACAVAAATSAACTASSPPPPPASAADTSSAAATPSRTAPGSATRQTASPRAAGPAQADDERALQGGSDRLAAQQGVEATGPGQDEREQVAGRDDEASPTGTTPQKAAEPDEAAEGPADEAPPAAEEPDPLKVLEGRATYYASSFAGKMTTSGETYDPKEMTAAMKRLELGSVVRVIRKDTGESVEVKVNDRLPKKMGAAIDLSRAAAEELEMIEEGIVPVRIEVLSTPSGETGG